MCKVTYNYVLEGDSIIFQFSWGIQNRFYSGSFAVSMATCAQVEVQKRKGESIPKGWAVDGQGEITEDPSKMLDEGGLLYLGGSEENGGYKGYGLGMMVEVLGGILGGGPFGQNIRSWKGDTRVANLVSIFMDIVWLTGTVLCVLGPDFHSFESRCVCS